MESRKPVHKLGETIHSLVGWKTYLNTNWVKSVCDIMSRTDSSIESEPTTHVLESSNMISELEDKLVVLADYVNHLNAQRRHILNEFLDLRGNIRVFCRIRPISQGQLRPVVAAVDSTDVVLRLTEESKRKTYSFDKVFHPASTQDEVFAEIEPVVKSALDGYNSCIFAYGQTGTGKSYTMEGTPDTPGMVYRAMEAMFKQAADSNHAIVFSFSMLEIYLGNLRDLLLPQPTKPMDPSPPCLSIQTDPNGGIEIDNLVSIRVTDFNQALRLYSLGCRFRSTASTNSNSISSRSHCLTRLSITCFNAPERRRETNKMWFIDLGGSERVLKTKASGRRLDEGKAINLSLSALGDVIHALHNKTSHVPYRNSKLTQVLKDSLGEDSKTLMLVHVSPKEEDLCETVCSLSFATRVRSIHLRSTESTEEKEQREIAIENLQQKMKMIEEERLGVRKQINKLNEDLEKLTGRRPQPCTEELNLSKQNNLQPKKIKTTGIKEAEKPRFMKATVSSTRRKSAVHDYQSFEERFKFKFPAGRIRGSNRRAESVSLPVKQRLQSESNSECSVSRNSYLVDLNLKSNEDDETVLSNDTIEECDIKNVISVQQKGFLPNSGTNKYGEGKKNRFGSAKVDNWLQLHKNEPTITTSISHKSKRVLATMNVGNDKKLEKCVDVAESGNSEEQVEIQINLEGFIDKEIDDKTALETSLVDEILIEDEKCASYFMTKEDFEKPGICHLLLRKIQIVSGSALLVLGLQDLGIGHEFFHGLTL